MKDSYIGLFRAFPRGNWEVKFPDLPGCQARGTSFKDVFEAARQALAEYLAEVDGLPPRPRSSAELLIDAQRDWSLCRDFANSVMYPVKPADRDQDLAPIELVARCAGGGEQAGPLIGA